MSGRLKLKSIYPTFEEFKEYCDNCVFEFYPQIIDMPQGLNQMHDELDRYIYKPIYRQFKNATCRYLPTNDGIEAFNNQFANTLEEIVFDFLVYTSSNIYYFNEAYANIGQNLEQGVNTFNNPINKDIKNTKANTVIADGATSQSINLMIYNGKTSWRKAFSSYYTPQRKAELIDRFRWLFISFYVGSDEGVTLVELSEALSMANGDMVITPEEAEILRKVIIEKPSTLIPENIKKGVDIGGVIGEMEESKIMFSKMYTLLVTTENGDKFYSFNNVFNSIRNFIDLNRNKLLSGKISCILPTVIGSIGFDINFVAIDDIVVMCDKINFNIYIEDNSLQLNGVVTVQGNISNDNLYFTAIYNNTNITQMLNQMLQFLAVSVIIIEGESDE